MNLIKSRPVGSSTMMDDGFGNMYDIPSDKMSEVLYSMIAFVFNGSKPLDAQHVDLRDVQNAH